MSEDRVTVTPEQLDELANTLHASMNGLREATPAGEVDAGISTGVVSEALEAIYRSVAAMVGDTESEAHKITSSGGEYTRSDEQAASEFPPWLAVPSNLEGGQ